MILILATILASAIPVIASNEPSHHGEGESLRSPSGPTALQHSPSHSSRPSSRTSIAGWSDSPPPQEERGRSPLPESIIGPSGSPVHVNRRGSMIHFMDTFSDESPHPWGENRRETPPKNIRPFIPDSPRHSPRASPRTKATLDMLDMALENHVRTKMSLHESDWFDRGHHMDLEENLKLVQLISRMDPAVSIRLDAMVFPKGHQIKAVLGGIKLPFPGKRTILRTNSLPSSMWRYHNKMRVKTANAYQTNTKTREGLHLYMDASMASARKIQENLVQNRARASEIHHRLAYARPRIPKERRAPSVEEFSRLNHQISKAESDLHQHVDRLTKLHKAGFGRHNIPHDLRKYGLMQYSNETPGH